ncbi:MAG: family 10 glycosylhydrolase [Clostridia bacterium]|nr:family 10 glycosylhydrolase [Clostridia bacterium]
MKKLLFCVTLLLTLLTVPVWAKQAEMRGVWVSSVYNLDYPSRQDLSGDQLRQEADSIIANAKAWGLNAVFLQVRPSADALYASELVPWSGFLSGAQGQAPRDGFDPLAYFVEQCHAQGLELHAWINPYRITRTAAASREEAFAQLCDGHPARQLAEHVVFHSDGCLYYDPGKPEVRQHLLAVSREILENYPVDGLHLDDYFYPGSGFADEDTYRLYGGDFADIGDFRRDAVCQLIDALHKLTEEVRPEAVFGVSPAGIWATKYTMAMGADATGSQSYFDHFADSRRWVREGMVDYIMPQIYWELGSSTSDFGALLEWWSHTVDGTDVDLYIGLAAYKSAEAQVGSVWYGIDELQRQLDAVNADEQAAGVVFFRYGSLLQTGVPAGLEPPAEPPVISRETFWPDALTLDTPQGNVAVNCGQKVQFSCTAPRMSQVSVFYGNGWSKLTSHCDGTYSGWVSAETPYETEAYTAPALVCTERFGMVSVKLTPYTVTSVQTTEPVALQDIQWSEDGEDHLVVFRTDAPCAAAFNLRGDVLSIALSPARMGVLFNDDYFARMTCEQSGDKLTYRLVFPDDGQTRQCELLWAPDSITLRIRKNQPDLPEADR